jgi:uncharacterized protein (DUF1778 family)
MPRPKTMSDPIRIRVPLPNYALLEAKATAKGWTVDQFVKDYVIRATDALLAKEAK